MSIYQDQLADLKAKGFFQYFVAASEKYSIPLKVLLGISSRETGCCNIIGDKGNGRGLMQIDLRYHGDWCKEHNGGMDAESNIDYGASILFENIAHFQTTAGGDGTNFVLPKAVAAYNCGIAGVGRALHAGLGVDGHTTGGNYSKDVLERAEEFEKLLEGGRDLAPLSAT